MTRQKLKFITYPLSFFYGLIVELRNFLFDSGILSSQKFRIPIISVGNITVGGTGKTPHTELLLQTLSEEVKVAMLSRGYKRETKGFYLANEQSNSQNIGDEPYQMFLKFPKVKIAVDNNRCHGIETLLKKEFGPDLNAIILDDAYQHRYVSPGINILLIDYNRPITKDKMLPYGNLREPAHNKDRANIVIVTKCPIDAKPIDYRIITKDLDLRPYQTLYFTTYEYKTLYPVFDNAEIEQLEIKDLTTKNPDILLFTGIASQNELADFLRANSNSLTSLRYEDHYKFTAIDLNTIAEKFENINSANKLLITTEKDAARLLSLPNIPEIITKNLYCIPIKIKFLFEKEKDFKKQILDYVRKNTTNNLISKK